MTALAQGRVVLWEGGSLWVLDVPALPGTPQRTDFHAHHAIQITLALDGKYELYEGNGSVHGPSAVVAANVKHAFEPKGLIGLVFVEPESPAGRTLSSTLLADRPVAVVPPELLGDLIRRLAAVFRDPDATEAALRSIGRNIVAALTSHYEPSSPDPRIEATIAWAARNLDRQLTAAEAARTVGLSAGRMSHLFVEQTGLAFRTYVLWLRISRAVEAYAAGASLTEAAHDAGFADSAHFSRTFRRMFGVSAATLRFV